MEYSTEPTPPSTSSSKLFILTGSDLSSSGGATPSDHGEQKLCTTLTTSEIDDIITNKINERMDNIPNDEKAICETVREELEKQLKMHIQGPETHAQGVPVSTVMVVNSVLIVSSLYWFVRIGQQLPRPFSFLFEAVGWSVYNGVGLIAVPVGAVMGVCATWFRKGYNIAASN